MKGVTRSRTITVVMAPNALIIVGEDRPPCEDVPSDGVSQWFQKRHRLLGSW